jgi:hypothetical protein
MRSVFNQIGVLQTSQPSGNQVNTHIWHDVPSVIAALHMKATSPRSRSWDLRSRNVIPGHLNLHNLIQQQPAAIISKTRNPFVRVTSLRPPLRRLIKESRLCFTIPIDSRLTLWRRRAIELDSVDTSVITSPAFRGTVPKTYVKSGVPHFAWNVPQISFFKICSTVLNFIIQKIVPFLC